MFYLITRKTNKEILLKVSPKMFGSRIKVKIDIFTDVIYKCKQTMKKSSLSR